MSPNNISEGPNKSHSHHGHFKLVLLSPQTIFYITQDPFLEAPPRKLPRHLVKAQVHVPASVLGGQLPEPPCVLHPPVDEYIGPKEVCSFLSCEDFGLPSGRHPLLELQLLGVC